MNAKTAKATAPLMQAFSPFSWLTKAAQDEDGAQFVQITREVARGISLIVDLVHTSMLKEDNGDTPIIGMQAREDLIRLAVSTAKLLERAAEDQCEAIDHAASKKRGAE